MSEREQSIEYAHIYTNDRIGDEQKLSLKILKDVTKDKDDFSLVVMVDDYSFPDPVFNYNIFSDWLDKEGFKPNLIIRESQLIPLCDEVIKLILDKKLKEEISNYIRHKKYPCSLFVASWYLLRLGHLVSPIFRSELKAKKIINILPVSFKPFEEKAFEIIKTTKFKDSVNQIENKYFEGRALNQ